ncbi:MAG: hypothetical protein J2P45_09075 [Candidatus Dormibacteraeota bacterium]|nr:hypothetical protein [Candidatus Dormibacteraeota bacterium]
MKQRGWRVLLARFVFGALVLSAAIAAIVVHPRIAVGLLVAPGAHRLAAKPWFRSIG